MRRVSPGVGIRQTSIDHFDKSKFPEYFVEITVFRLFLNNLYHDIFYRAHIFHPSKKPASNFIPPEKLPVKSYVPALCG